MVTLKHRLVPSSIDLRNAEIRRLDREIAALEAKSDVSSMDRMVLAASRACRADAQRALRDLAN
jgi:hypothetical protein